VTKSSRRLRQTIVLTALLCLPGIAAGADRPVPADMLARFLAEADSGKSAAAACFPDPAKEWQKTIRCVTASLGHAQDASIDTDGFRLGFGRRAIDGLESIRAATLKTHHLDRRDWPEFAELEDLLLEAHEDSFKTSDKLVQRLCDAAGASRPMACTQPDIAPRATKILVAAAAAPSPAHAACKQGKDRGRHPACLDHLSSRQTRQKRTAS
jgi:hypothetical protein